MGFAFQFNRTDGTGEISLNVMISDPIFAKTATAPLQAGLRINHGLTHKSARGTAINEAKQAGEVALSLGFAGLDDRNDSGDGDSIVGCWQRQARHVHKVERFLVRIHLRSREPCLFERCPITVKVELGTRDFAPVCGVFEDGIVRHVISGRAKDVIGNIPISFKVL
jgi:hypothetical protein